MAEVEVANMTEEVASDQEITAPLVFSCAHCRTIIGDSFSFLHSDEKKRTITLSSASNIERTEDAYTSKGGDDIGSTYFVFNCCCCHTTIGRYYMSTCPDLDHLRGKFTISIDEITSYELGKSQHGQLPEPISSADNTGQQGNALTNEENDLSPKALNNEILKVQHVVMDLLTRVTSLEQQTAAAISSSLHSRIVSSIDGSVAVASVQAALPQVPVPSTSSRPALGTPSARKGESTSVSLLRSSTTTTPSSTRHTPDTSTRSMSSGSTKVASAGSSTTTVATTEMTAVASAGGATVCGGLRKHQRDTNDTSGGRSREKYENSIGSVSVSGSYDSYNSSSRSSSSSSKRPKM